MYRHDDNDGRGLYQLGDMTSPNPRPNLMYTWKGFESPTAGWRYSRETMTQLDAEGRIWYPDAKSKRPRLKRYLSEMDGPVVNSIWTDINPIGSQAKERLGYATQKPLALLERIIKASSDSGDLVFDPFCGCGTTVHAAQNSGRRWIGVDISGDAIDEIKDRMAGIGVYDGQDYDIREGSPDTVAEYNRLNPYEKQDWLIRRLGGLPNPRKSGDMGIDGDLTFHLGGASAETDKWGRLVFSVKTGRQRKPEHIRELIGTMRNEKAEMGALILDADPTPGMESAAQRAGRIKYQPRSDFPPKTYDKVQIFTAYEIIDGATLDCPPSMHDVRRYRELQPRMRI
ncbi:MAG: site-specific DNA-methyltransferase [Chloroflexi bacterium]|nr:site-specific DNA-methyltransferase [Chloroflexota bacterium]